MMHAALQCNDWRTDRLREARAVLADIPHQPVSLVLLACRVIAAHSTDRIEVEDAGKTAALLRANREVRP